MVSTLFIAAVQIFQIVKRWLRNTKCVIMQEIDTLNDLEEEAKYNEPLLKHDKGRFVLYPIQHEDIWDMYKQAEASFWTAEEIDLTDDIKDWAGLTRNERHFVSHILAFFAASDGIVIENLCSNFATEIKVPEARCFYGFQIAIENIHSETYSLLIDTFIKNATEKSHLLNAIDTIPCVQKKANWALKWCNANNSTFPERMVSLVCANAVHYLSSLVSSFIFHMHY